MFEGLKVVGLVVGFAPARSENSLVDILLLAATGLDDTFVVGAEETDISGAEETDVTGAKDGADNGVDPLEVQVHIKVHSFCCGVVHDQGRPAWQ